MKNYYPNLFNVLRLQSRSVSISTMKNNKEVQKMKKESSTCGLSKLYCSPSVQESVLKNIKSVVGIQIGLSYVSWAKIETEVNNLTCLNLLTLPDDIYRMELHQIYTVANKVISILPSADCFAMENLPKIVSGQGGKLQLSLQATRMQFIAMVVAMLNQQQNLNHHRVLFMKPRTTAKLFNLLVGAETISSEEVVSRLLSNNNVNPFSSVKCDPEVVEKYNLAQRVDKEMLGQAFLLTLSFAELMLYKNEKCYKILLDTKKKS